jgi:hypothetical protein
MVSILPLGGTLLPWQMAESVKWSNRLGREPGLKGRFIFCGATLVSILFLAIAFLNGLAALSFLE